MSIYEEVEFEDLDYDPQTQIYTYPCPCGDKFSISLEALWEGEDIATCPSCTLRIEIIYDESDLPPLRKDDDEDVDDDERKEEVKEVDVNEAEHVANNGEEIDDRGGDLSTIAMSRLAVR